LIPPVPPLHRSAEIMKLLLIALFSVTVNASADLRSSNDEWFADSTPGFVRLKGESSGDGKTTVTWLNLDHIVRLSIKTEGKDDSSVATLEIVTTELNPERLRGSKGAENVTYVVSFGSRQKAEMVARLIMKKKAEQAGTGQPATRPESKLEGSDKAQPEAEGRSR
jgi:hypothetical protein